MQAVIEHIEQSIASLNNAIAEVPTGREVLSSHLKHLRGLLAAQSRFLKPEAMSDDTERVRIKTERS